MARTSRFEDLSGLVTLLKASLVIFMAVVAAGLWSGWREISLLQRLAAGEFVMQSEAEANDSRQMLFGVLYLIAFCVTAIIFLRWTYLSNRNARALGASGMSFTPGWSVGWYFIPVALLWMPYQALKEIFKASHPGFTNNWRRAPVTGLLPIWWMLWIISTIIGQLVLRTAVHADTVDQLLTASWIMFVSDIVNISLGIVVIALVSQLHAWQSAKRRLPIEAVF